MEAVARPDSWAAAGLESAVFSDPGPTAAVIAAIHEREALFETEGGGWDNSLPPVELVRQCAPEARRESVRFVQFVRDVPNRLMASIIYRKIQRLAGRFVDMDYDYAARDWSEFPVMLSERFERGEHPMGWCPDYHDPESDESCAAWRSFLADARWWLDRMHVVVVAEADYRCAKRATLSGGYGRTTDWPGTADEQETESGTPIEDMGDVQPSVSTGVYQASSPRLLGAVISLSATNESTIVWDSTTQDYTIRSTARAETFSGLAYADLRVRNRYPMTAALLLVACGAKDAARRNYVSLALNERHVSSYHLSFDEPEDGSRPSIDGVESVYEEAWQPLAAINATVHVFDRVASDLSGGTRTRTGWSHDFSDSASRQESAEAQEIPATTVSDPARSLDDTTWTAVPRPGLVGLSALGPNAGGTLAAGARSSDLLPFAAGYGSIAAEDFWLPESLHGYTLCNERISAAVTFGVAVIPCLDFESSFRFHADTPPSEP